jgi:hypothetical protein
MATTPRKQPLDHLMSRKKPVRKTVYLAADADMLELVRALEEEVRRLRMAVQLRKEPVAAERLPLAEEELKAAHASLEDDAIKFTFQAMRRDKYDRLLQEHPPTEAQVEEVKKGDAAADLQFNLSTFPVALIMACMAEPNVSDTEDFNTVQTWLESEAFNGTEILTLFQTCMAVNSSSTLVQVGKESRRTTASA